MLIEEHYSLSPISLSKFDQSLREWLHTMITSVRLMNAVIVSAWVHFLTSFPFSGLVGVYFMQLAIAALRVDTWDMLRVCLGHDVGWRCHSPSPLWKNAEGFLLLFEKSRSPLFALELHLRLLITAKRFVSYSPFSQCFSFAPSIHCIV